MAKFVIEGQARTTDVEQSFSRLEKLSGSLQRANQDAAGALSTFGINLGALNNPLTLIATGLKSSIDYAIKYSDEIDQLARVTGTGAKQASILATVMGDLGVSTGTLEQAAKKLKDNGMVPSLDTIKKLSAEYRAIQDPVAKNKFLFDNLGRAGLEMADALDRDVSQFDELARTAANSGKVLDEAMIQRMEDAQIKAAKLQDRIDGLKVTVGTFAVDTLSDAGDGLDNVGKLTAALSLKIQVATGAISEESAAMQAQLLATGSLHTAYNDMADARAEAITQSRDNVVALVDEKEALAQNADAVKFLNDAMSGAVSKEMQAYADKQDDLRKKADDLTAQIAKYEHQQGRSVTVTKDATTSDIELQLASIALSEAQQKLSETSADNTKEYLQAQLAVQNAGEKLTDLQGKMGSTSTVTLDYTTKLTDLRAQLGEVNAALGDNAAAHEDQTRRILFGIVQQQLAIDGYTTDELQSLNTLAEKWGLIDQATADATNTIIASVAKAHETENWNALIGDLDALDKKVRGVGPSFDDLTGRSEALAASLNRIPRNVDVTITQHGGLHEQGVGGMGGYQHGGSFIFGGAGSGDRPYTINAEPGEMGIIIPRSQTWNNTFNLGGGGMDMRALAREVAGILGAQADTRIRTGG